MTAQTKSKTIKPTATMPTFPLRIEGLNIEPARITPQLVIFLDIAGNIHAETGGQNGQRRKIDLPEDFRERNPEIYTALCEARDLAARRAQPAPAIVRRDFEVERAERIAREREAHKAAYWAHYETLTEADKAIEDERRAIFAEREKQAELDRAHRVWHNTARHDVHLANRAIAKDRRPRSAEALTNLATGEKPRRAYKIDPTLALDIEL